ncbi:glutathionylspermidine synthase family protein [Neolewinella antarctica]|uniref:Glutathionylspermidine synthase n=1 Tax=Neolewinella antarctica TaxID=442734 RepID=A0ABX0X961_9BACT|nr:glutathionylspermidine synthase family protein [Neolewinella antarctica]NJC25717.1 glutathionylspermidine synthase [Neolewinella antarctica]
MDKRLRDAPVLPEKFFRQHGLEYYATGENHDYLSDEILLVSAEEEANALRVADELFEILRSTAKRCLIDPSRLDRMGIPERARPLVQWSFENEWDDYCFGRFDFAGGLDGLPLQLLELNADTSSLLPEATIIQPEVVRKAGFKPLKNTVEKALTEQFTKIKAARGKAIAAGAHLGHEDDRLNLETLLKIARKAKWQADEVELPELIFEEEGGLLVEKGEDKYTRYYYLLKFFPWDWALTEEPQLWDLLEKLCTKNLVRVLNPAWTMLLQNKALLAYAWQDNPGHPALLPTAFDPADLPNPALGYVRKPIYGRMGENIMISRTGRGVDAETRGDYGAQQTIYQQLAPFGMDDEDYRYQLSVFMTPGASGLCCRRGEGLILGDEGEFVSLGVHSQNGSSAKPGWKFW